MYARIVVPLDGSQLAEQVLPHVEALAATFGSHITLLRATTPDQTRVAPAPGLVPTSRQGTASMPLAEVERREASQYLSTIAQQLEHRNLAVGYETQAGAAAAVIVEGARRLNADLIAMTTHGEGGLGRLLFGSVADEVLRRAACPILLVRAGAATSN